MCKLKKLHSIHINHTYTHQKREVGWREQRIKEGIENKNNAIRTKIMNDKFVSIQKE